MSVFHTAKQGMAGKKQHFLKKPSSIEPLENLPLFLSVRRIHFTVLAHKKMMLKLMK
jgi:hypothetical protein